MDKKNYIDLYEEYILNTKEIQKYYDKYQNIYLPLSNKQERDIYFSKYRKTELQAHLLFKMAHSNKYKSTCFSTELIDFLNYLEDMKTISYKPENYDSEIKIKSTFGMVLKTTYSCKNLQEKSWELIKYFSPELTKELNNQSQSKGETNGN